jgi:hypothetical protein
MRIEHYDTGGLIDCGNVAFSYEVTERPRDLVNQRNKTDSLDWNRYNNFMIGDYRIHPYGDQNDLPEQIRQVIQNHYMASSQLTKKTQMMWGQGPHLYKESFKNGYLEREWVNDIDVWNWIKSWDGEDYLMRCSTDWEHIKGTFTKFYQGRGGRIGKNNIAKLEHVSPNKARLASKMKFAFSKPTHAVVTDWDFNHINNLTDYKAYKLFDHNNPFAERNSIYYSNMYSFATDYYTVPDLYGSLEWLRRSTAIPYIFKALSDNSMNVKYHLQSPSSFWDSKRTQIKDECHTKNKEYSEALFVAYQKNFLKKVAEVLSGQENVGKFWHSEKMISVDGQDIKEHGWELKPIDQNVKDFIDAHIKLSDKADRVIASTFGLHPSLGNVSANGNSDSGSEQGYAFKNYINSGVDIPEMIVCKPLNYALMANFPTKGLKIGFYRTVTKLESETTPGKRIINN